MLTSRNKKESIKSLEKRREKLLKSDRWLNRNGHTLTYVGIFLFTFSVYFRPYEWIPGFSAFTSMALICAVASLLIYLPSQLATEGNFTIFTTEVKCIFFIAFWALLTMPISKDPGMAWETFYDLYSKVVLMFIVMINTLRSRSRLTGLIWLSLGIGAVVSYLTIDAYFRGDFIEGYRAKADFKGMFDNPNDMCVHLVMFLPIAVALGLSTSKIAKLSYFSLSGLMLMAVFSHAVARRISWFGGGVWRFGLETVKKIVFRSFSSRWLLVLSLRWRRPETTENV